LDRERERRSLAGMETSTLATSTGAEASLAVGQLVRLPGGRPLLVRPIAATDKHRLADAYARMSDDSRRRRFLSTASAPTARDLGYFTEVDHHGHEAVVGIDPASGALVGAAHYVRVPETEGDAELSAEVVDDWQRRGVATALLAALTDRARREGVRHFVAIVSEENRPVIGMLERAGAMRCRVAGELAFAIEIPEIGTPDPLRHALRAAAATSDAVSLGGTATPPTRAGAAPATGAVPAC
jgi:RimJ/RimL family protein N-acetyltransferase